jgi:hypothetical protein
MKLSEKLSILGELGVIDWLQGGDGDEHIRILVNALASDYCFQGKDYIDFAPPCDFKTVRSHFEDAGYDIDWYGLITLEFAESIEFDSFLAVDDVSEDTSNPWAPTGAELEKFIIGWVREWCETCRKSFIYHLSGE